MCRHFLNKAAALLVGLTWTSPIHSQDLSVSPLSAGFSDAGGSLTITVEAYQNGLEPDRFQATSSSEWLSVEPDSAEGEIGGVQIVAAVRPFDQGGSRIGRIRIRTNSGLQATIRIRQQGNQDCNPGPDEVVVFSDATFFGECMRFGLGDYPNAFVGGQVEDDQASSIRVGQNVVAELCRNADFFGRCSTFSEDKTQFVSTQLGDNSASAISVRLQGTIRCEPSAGEVSLYIHSNYRGACQVFDSGVHDLISVFGAPRVSSVRVGEGTELELRDSGVTTERRYIRSNVRDLETIGFNDEAVELEVLACDPGVGEVTLRRGVDLRGNCRVLSTGQYTRTGLGGFRRLDFTSISSVEIGAETTACLCVTDVELNGSTKRTCTFSQNTILDMADTAVGNDRTSFVGVGMSEQQCSAYDSAGDVAVDGDMEPGWWESVAIVNCQLSKEPLFAWLVSEGQAAFSPVGTRDSDFASLTGPSECVAADGGLSISLGNGANIVRLVDPVACGAEVEAEGMTREQYVATLKGMPENDPNDYRCLQLDLPILGAGEATLELSVQ